MRYFVTKEQLEAIHNTRHTRSPGGTAALMGISRQRVMQLVDKRTNERGMLAWCYRYRNKWGGDLTTCYVDLGAWGPQDALMSVDPKQWWGQTPEEILSESEEQYQRMIAEHRSEQLAEV